VTSLEQKGSPIRPSGTSASGALWLIAFLAFILFTTDRFLPPPNPALLPLSPTVLGRNGELLRPFAVDGGRWRLGVKLSDVDPLLQRMIIAYEDKRFYNHLGVDPVASVRALKQLAITGHIVSGGSTLTMQLARLLEHSRERSVAVKLRQMARAVQLEMRYSKEQILSWYFTFAPYGGNLEGVRAASLSWFGKEPKKLSVAEAALLVAIPQSPEARRPDRFPARVKAARDRVIIRMKNAGVIAPEDALLALAEPLPELRQDLPSLAAHAADAAHAKGISKLTIDAKVQAHVERLMREASTKLDPTIGMAVLVADSATGEVIARAGSAKPFDQQSRGWNDMTRAVRSPGSTLKPFIYGLAFENGIAHPETLVEDRAENFRGYRPKNFNQSFHGTISLRKALQLSLNLPAVKLLDAVGPLRLAAAFRDAGVKVKLPRNSSPTLAVALGGVGMTLDNLVTLYSALPRGGVPFTLHDEFQNARETAASPEMFGINASWYVADILSGTAAPDGVLPLRISYKTGTSYGYRDAWAVGFDQKYVIGVWVGRADGTAVSELSGRTAAAPLLFKVFDALKPAQQRARALPPSTIISDARVLPATLKHFGVVTTEAQASIHAPQIMFPPDGAKLGRELAEDGTFRPVVMKLEGGTAPYMVLVNGKPMQKHFRTRNIAVEPGAAGYSNLTVVDATGLVTAVNVFVE
jgi:penicillin-binding protein 1C